jgi:hypothetical protein
VSPVLLPLGSLEEPAAAPVLDGTPKSCAVCVVPLGTRVADDAGSEPDPLPLELPLPVELPLPLKLPLPVELPLLLKLPLPDVAEEGSVAPPLVSDDVGDDMKPIPLDEPEAEAVGARLSDGIVALSLVAAAPLVPNKPELYAVADGLEPEVTEKLSDPSLEISHGAPDAGVPPFRLAPMT